MAKDYKKDSNGNYVVYGDGGTKYTFIANDNDNGGIIEIERGYKETSYERKERIQNSPRSRKFENKKNRVKGGRSGANRKAIRDSE